jgi:hypothetical protein
VLLHAGDHWKGYLLINSHKKLASVGLLAGAVFFTTLAGCDSTPPPPPDTAPPIPKQEDVLPDKDKKKLGKTIPRNIKDRSQQQPQPQPEAAKP